MKKNYSTIILVSLFTIPGFPTVTEIVIGNKRISTLANKKFREKL